MSVQSVLDFLYGFMERPFVILLIIPLIFLFIYWLRKDFIQLKEDPQVIAQKKRLQKIMMVTRPLIALLLLIAIATPYFQTEKIISGDVYVKLLTDNSTSMSLLESVAGELAKNLEKKVTVETYQIGSKEKSDIGDGILNHLEPYDSVLLVTDGNNNAGSDLGDVALFASRINSTINAIKLKEIQNDASIVVLGPAKTQEGVENAFTAVVNRVGTIGPVKVTITFDGQTVYDQETTESVIEFTQTMTPGHHRIKATIGGQDFFPQNNVFYKTVKVVPKPKIFYWSEGTSPMKTLLDQFYVVESSASLPSNLDAYYAVATNNIDAAKAEAQVERLTDFVADGNGMVVLGGSNSFDQGGYKGSLFETMLPVFVSAPGKKEGEINIVMVIDISGSTGAAFGDSATVDVEKALAVGVLHDLKLDNRLAVIAFNTQAYLISEPSYVYEKANLEQRLSRLRDGGGTIISAGILKAVSLLSPLQGSKNIILISDGKTQSEAAALESAKMASNLGIKMFTVGVGPTTNENLMIQLADITNGVFFRATDSSRLKILFGETDEKEQEAGKMGLVALNANHFITEGFEPKATIYGFNQVVPKTTGRLLVTTTTGEPVLTIWRLGLGRVAAWTTDDGGNWAGETLGKYNSRLHSRMFNWAIGDPDRKAREFIEAHDTRVFEPTDVIVKSETQPTAEGQVFYKIDEDLYSTTLTPTEVGFQQVLTATFAANSPAEYEQIGMHPQMENIVRSTGGKMFDASQIDEIVAHTQTKAKRTTIAKQTFRWPFALAAIILFLIEIFIRRIIRKD